MATTITDDVAYYLSTRGVGSLYPPGSPLMYIGGLPKTPDNAIAIIPRGGDRFDGTNQATYQVQVITRSALQPEAYGRADQVWQALTGYTGYLQPGGNCVVRCDAVAPPASLQQDQNGRYEYVVNFDILVDHKYNAIA